MPDNEQVSISSLILALREDLREFRADFRVEMQRTDDRLAQTISRAEFDIKVVPRQEHETRWREQEARLAALEADTRGDRKTALQWGLLILPVLFTFLGTVVAILTLVGHGH